MLPLVYRRFWLAGAWLVALAIVVGSLLPGPLIAVVSTWDKLQHAIAYGLLTFWLLGLLERSRYLWAAAITLALGVAVEVAQGLLTATRIGDPLDIVANATGVGLALLIAWLGLGGWAEQVERWLGVAPPRQR
jgi:VanZ family protein